jgi:hypothetical protein
VDCGAPGVRGVFIGSFLPHLSLIPSSGFIPGCLQELNN